MNIGGSIVGGISRLPLLTPHKEAVARRRGLAIHGYVGPNGAGKSLLAAADTIPTLRGVQWNCDNPDHLHTMEGVTSGTRRVLSTMPFITPSGKPHPLYVPLTDFSQIISAEHVDLILDEVGGAVASSTADNIPMGVKASLQELRRREVVCRWTAPSWKRASNILRECSQGVTLTLGFMPVPHKDGVLFPGPHFTEQLSKDGETLEKHECREEGEHSHPSGRLWGAKRLMFARTFDANLFEEFTTAKKDNKKYRPVVRELFWRPGSAAERSYDTHGYVEKLGQVTMAGTCDHCGGTRRRPTCNCENESPSKRRAAAAASRRLEAAAEHSEAPAELLDARRAVVVHEDCETTALDIVSTGVDDSLAVN